MHSAQSVRRAMPAIVSKQVRDRWHLSDDYRRRDSAGVASDVVGLYEYHRRRGWRGKGWRQSMSRSLERGLRDGTVVFGDLLRPRRSPLKAGPLDPYPITLRNLNSMLNQAATDAQRQHSALGRRAAKLRQEGLRDEASSAARARRSVGQALMLMAKATDLIGTARDIAERA